MANIWADDFDAYSAGADISSSGDWVLWFDKSIIAASDNGTDVLLGVSGTGYHVYEAQAAISTADYEVSVDIYRHAVDLGTDYKGVFGRRTGSYYYWLRYSISGVIQLYVNDGSWTNLGQYNYTMAVGETLRLRLRMDGDLIEAYINEATSPIISVTNTALPDAGTAGLWHYGDSQYSSGWTLAKGLYWDNFSIDDLGAASGTTYQVAALDGVSLSESTSITTIIQGAAIDGVDFVDSPLSLLSIQGTVEDGVSLSESLAVTLSIQYTVVDGVSLSDSTFVTLTIHSTVVDGVIISDLAGASLTMPVQVSDSIVSSDGVNGTLTLSVSAVDGFAMSDDGSATMVISATAIDGVGFSDYPAGNCTFVVSAQDGSVLSELASVVMAGDYPVIVTMEVTSKASGMTFSAASGSMMFSAKRAKITFNN
jgi:hypothetical protein